MLENNYGCWYSLLFNRFILRMTLLRLLNEVGPTKKYSEEGLLTELEKIQLTIFQSKSPTDTNVSGIS